MRKHVHRGKVSTLECGVHRHPEGSGRCPALLSENQGLEHRAQGGPSPTPGKLVNTGFSWLQNSSCLLTNTSPPSAHHTRGQPSVGEGVWKARVNGTVREGQVAPTPPNPMSLGSWETDVWPGRSLSSVQPPAGSAIQGRPGLLLGPASEYEQRPGPAEGGEGLTTKRPGPSPRPGPPVPAQSCCCELASPDEKLLSLTVPAPSWPSSPISQPRRGLSASPPVCWPARRIKL